MRTLKRILRWAAWSPARLAAALVAVAVVAAMAFKLAGPTPGPAPAGEEAGASQPGPAPGGPAGPDGQAMATAARFIAGWSVADRRRDELLEPVAETVLYRTLTLPPEKDRVTVTPAGDPAVVHLEDNLAIVSCAMEGRDTVWLFAARNNGKPTGWWITSLMWQAEAEAVLETAGRFFDGYAAPAPDIRAGLLGPVTAPDLYEALTTGPTMGEAPGATASPEPLAAREGPVIIGSDAYGVRVRKTFTQTTLVVTARKDSRGEHGWEVTMVDNRQ